MKKLSVVVIALLSMASCTKDGHMYKACFINKSKLYGGGDVSGSITTNFFIRDDKDSLAAVEWYKKTDAYKIEITRCDSFCIVYWGTAEEWNR